MSEDAASVGGGPMPLSVGRRIGPWRIISPISSGEWGSVYAARRVGARAVGDDAPDEVALKVMPTRFASPHQMHHLLDAAQREKRRHERLVSTHLIRTYAVFTVDDPQDERLNGAVVLVMDAAVGSLADVVNEAGGKGVPKAGELIVQICEGLAYMHGKGWVHGDLKPANVLVMADGTIRLTDFGLATELNGTHAYLPPVGSLDYVPPERRNAPMTSAGSPVRQTADIWALGVTACQLLTGHLPFSGRDPYERRQAVADYAANRTELRLDPALSNGWRSFLENCLAPTHHQRRHTATSLLEQARQLASGGTGPSSRNDAKLYPWMVVAAAVVVVVTVVLAWWGLDHLGRPVTRSAAPTGDDFRGQVGEVAILPAVPVPPAGLMPNLQLPFSCGERWQLSPRAGGRSGQARFDLSTAADGETAVRAVTAPAAGTVKAFVEPAGLQIDYGGGWSTVLLDLQRPTVSVGEEVKQGSVIGELDTAQTGSAHLGYELHQDTNGSDQPGGDEVVDPVFNGVRYHFDPGDQAPSITSANCLTSPRTPTWFLSNVPGYSYHTIAPFTYSRLEDLPLIGDWDDDSAEEVGLYRPTVQQFFFRGDNGEDCQPAVVYGEYGDLPLAGNWDADPEDEIGVYRPSTRTFQLRDDAGQTLQVIAFGDPGDLPLIGNWDADAADEVGVYRPASSTFILRGDSGQVLDFIHYGNPSDVPIIGNWDADLTDEIGVYRSSPQTGRFYFRSDTGHPLPLLKYGNPHSIPVVGDWDGDGRSTQGILQ